MRGRSVAGVGDHDVDRAKLVFDRRDCGTDRLAITDIGRCGDGLPRGGGDLLGRGFELGLSPRDQTDAIPGGAELESQRPADAA